MIENNPITDFSVKWLKKFRNDTCSPRELDEDPSFPQACFSMGFKMDCGKAFIAAYSEDAFNDCNALEKVIDHIDDQSLLGSAIFSKWRYFNH